jgi:hypothetical protein
MTCRHICIYFDRKFHVSSRTLLITIKRKVKEKICTTILIVLHSTERVTLTKAAYISEICYHTSVQKFRGHTTSFISSSWENIYCLGGGGGDMFNTIMQLAAVLAADWVVPRTLVAVDAYDTLQEPQYWTLANWDAVVFVIASTACSSRRFCCSSRTISVVCKVLGVARNFQEWLQRSAAVWRLASNLSVYVVMDSIKYSLSGSDYLWIYCMSDNVKLNESACACWCKYVW